MTTIAFDGKTMAGDSHCGGDFIGRTTKVVKVKGCLYGFAGNLEQCNLFIDWVKDGKPKEKPKNMSIFECLEYDGKNVYWWGEWMRGVKMNSPQAIGSGARFAQAAMLCGKNAREAVGVAKKLDVHTGGRVRTISLGAGK